MTGFDPKWTVATLESRSSLPVAHARHSGRSLNSSRNPELGVGAIPRCLATIHAESHLTGGFQHGRSATSLPLVRAVDCDDAVVDVIRPLGCSRRAGVAAVMPLHPGKLYFKHPSSHAPLPVP
jgi:hypothetical protein